jgi:hypothetical protein
MIKSLDRITYLANSLEKAEKTFSSFFNLKPSKRVISAEKKYESLIYIFENMCFEVIEKKDDLSEKNKLYGFSLLSDDLSSIDISIISEKNNRQEEFEDKVQSVKSIDIKQSPDFQLLVNEYENLDMDRANENNLFALDHLVLTTNKSDDLIDLYEKELGIRLALDQFVEKWGGRMLFFRTGQATIEVIDNKVEGNDQFWGLAWKTKDIRKKREYLIENGFNVSDVKDGRKKDTLVATVKFDEVKIPTLLVEHLK